MKNLTQTFVHHCSILPSRYAEKCGLSYIKARLILPNLPKSQICHTHCNSTHDSKFLHLPKNISEPYPPVYNAAHVEDGWYNWWKQSGIFGSCTKTEPNGVFSMILPPPNVTGTLHLGHALTTTVQDVLIRWHRMKGK